MYEMQLMALMNTLANWGTAPVIATRVIAADAPALNDLLRDPAIERRLVAGVSPRLRPQVQLSPRHNTRYVHADVRLLGHDVLWMTWLLTPDRGTTELDLAAQLVPRGLAARLALRAGRRRLRRRLEATLDDVATVARRTAEALDDAAPVAVTPAVGLTA
jgi:hypothetical protein